MSEQAVSSSVSPSIEAQEPPSPSLFKSTFFRLELDPALPPELIARVGELNPSGDQSQIEMAAIFATLEWLDNAGYFTGPKVPLLFAAGHPNQWMSTAVSTEALAWLGSRPCRNVDKHARSISLCQSSDGHRRKESCVAVTGHVFDDDGVIGRLETLPSDALVIAYATASDGKCSDTIPLDSFAKFSVKAGVRAKPTDETAARYLNQACEFGPAYKDVRVGKPTPEGYPVTFDPQFRMRYVNPFARPLRGEVLDRLKEDKELYAKFARACELEILGVNGCDPKTLQPVAVAYLPSGAKPDQFFKVYGSKLFDPYPIAERILAENPPKPPRVLKVGGEVSESDKGTLRGVMLASLISDRFDELASGSGTTPLVLKRCPFCDEHGSKRGQSDNSAYVYDPDPERGLAYPTVGCHHQTCEGRRTDEFVAEMIAQGELDREAVYDDPDYRMAIENDSDSPKAVMERFQQMMQDKYGV